jgi:hypothetical protein
VRAAPTLLLAGLAAVAVSCSWSQFDDLKSDSWITIVERNDTDTGGDFGLDLLALPPPPGAMGMRLVVSVGNPPAGMAQGTIDATGKLTQQIGYNALLGGSGALDPLNDQAAVFSMARYQGDTFIAGVPDRQMLIRYEGGLDRTGRTVYSRSDLAKMGRTVAVGNLGLGSANPDIVTIGQLSLTVIPNGGEGTTPITCNLQPPNPLSSPVVSAESLAVGPIAGNGHDQIVVSTFNLENTPRIYILEASDIRNGMNCPDRGFTVASPPPVAIALGNVDGDPRLDIVAGAQGSGGNPGTITVYPNVVIGQTPEAIVIPVDSTEDRASSAARGSRLRIANLDGEAGNEIIAGDAGASALGVSSAGQVQIYRMGACGSEGSARGPACLVTTLFDPSPDRDDKFGRALAIGTLMTASGEKPILAVAQKAKAWVYFKISPSFPDARN